MPSLVDQVVAIARQAGDAIMEIYETDFEKYEKSDASPLTEADLAAHKLICAELAKISEFPILSEESSKDEIEWENRKNWNTFWIVDPLDGTKEFIKKSGEFTVNIALVSEGKAKLGVVYCPPLNRMYFATEEQGAFRQDADAEPVKLQVASEPQGDANWNVVGSKSHGAEALAAFSEQLGNVNLVSMGSSLKLCMVADGQAHLYPRLAPTCEWDTAAAQAIVEHAGGKVLTPSLEPLLYGQKEDLLNPFFIVCATQNERWGKVFTELATPANA
ncbi:3'(2'),5'-bisphosphate nucleotidase CysQ [Oceanobacter kriegii]|uniref:3'(2'),5'-bisphosphate nucleotidase CysQ n=1 Tax=Oceanobacter kriegii TaxID=64972 RepID=UPI00040D8EB5|nr:3'(2'),5'-bisphosphate nucleotidase CysQ [Oceanobacter kriegii]